MYDLVEKPCCQFFLKFFVLFRKILELISKRAYIALDMIFRIYNILKIPVKSTNFIFLSLQTIYMQTYVMLCYMVIYIAPLTGDYSEALCIYKNVKQNTSCCRFLHCHYFCTKQCWQLSMYLFHSF